MWQRGKGTVGVGRGTWEATKRTGFHFTTTPTSDRHYLSVSHPFLSTTTHALTHTMPPLSLTPKIDQMSHQEAFAPTLQPDEESETFLENIWRAAAD